MGQFCDVIIAGAGPVGLYLACELGLAGTSVLVLERDIEAQSPWKSPTLGRRALNTGSVEAIYRRGLLDKFRELNNREPPFAKTLGFKFAGHFASINLDSNTLDLNRFKHRLEGPALRPHPTFIQRIETIFTERAESLGVTILRGKSFSKIAAQDAGSITVETEDNERFHGRWLVGCDGGRSLVRKAAGFEFTGTESKLTGYITECTLEDPEGLMQRGFHKTKHGMYLVAPETLYLMDFASQDFDRTTQTVTCEHLDKVLHVT
jgi:2-polyprenyl-6-methoxyphenol hydroxylase-like FAD-dependent oxidoreductase